MGSESKGGVGVLQIDETYEFCAPRFFDFMNDESEEEIRNAELWLEISQSYPPSPFMPKIKEGRSVRIGSLRDFGNVEQLQKKEIEQEASQDSNQIGDSTTMTERTSGSHDLIVADEAEAGQQKEMNNEKMPFELASEVKTCITRMLHKEDESSSVEVSSSSIPADNKEASSDMIAAVPVTLKMCPTAVEPCTDKTTAVAAKVTGPCSSRKQSAYESCTPRALRVPSKTVASSSSLRNQAAKKIASLIRQQAIVVKPKDQTPCAAQSSKSTRPPKSVIKYPGSITAKKNAIAIGIAQEDQAIKRQKLDDGRSRQILSAKTRVLPHKSKPDSDTVTDLFASSFRGYQGDLLKHKDQVPFISTAELVKKFQTNTRDIELSQNKSGSHESTASMIRSRPRLKLTRLLETSQRGRVVRVKSAAELEEEMLAKIPKFKARPVNKKILEAPTLPSLIRSVPKPPEFQEFHLTTMERASQHAEKSSLVSSVYCASQNHNKPWRLTEPKPPHLETLIRARPPKVKSSQQLELEELEMIPKFKAKPLNKKILRSKGDHGLFTNPKPQTTTPHEFHFATDVRLVPPIPVTEMFEKLSLHSESSSQHEGHEIPKNTIPNPFHLHTEERGLEKGRQFTAQILQKQLEEEKARIPKANPYPYTTDYPVIPPKPEPKQCTKPEAFQLDSLIRHEEEMQRKFEEKERMEREEAQKRLFKAQPIVKVDPIPLPERERKPLTEVQEFALHVNHRAAERSEFDKKIKEKVTMYKRQRDENEIAKKIEEEKVVKQMRREMVPNARPLRKFDNPFHPHKSTKDLTKAKSPMLHMKQREERRKHAFMR